MMHMLDWNMHRQQISTGVGALAKLSRDGKGLRRHERCRTEDRTS